MKKSILSIGLLLAVSFAVVSFTSCSSRKPNVIRAENILGSTRFVESVRIIREIEPTSTGRRIQLLAIAPLENNGFRLNLPLILPDKWLFPLDEFIEEAEGITISDKDARVYMLFRELSGWDNYGRIYGDFRLRVDDDRFWIETMWIYADRNVSITGEINGEFNEEYSLNLKRGWNRAYIINDSVNETHLMTTQRPADANFQWRFLFRSGSDGRLVLPDEIESKSLRSIKSLLAR